MRLEVVEILFIIALCLTFLFFIILIRAIGPISKQVQVNEVNDIVVDSKKISRHLSRAIQFKTVSYQDPEKFDEKEFLGLHEYLKEAFPKVHSKLTREVLEEYSLLFTWKGKVEALKPIILLAHMDIVPVENGTEDDWDFPPFDGRISEGYIWGRGTLDDKVGMLGILDAVEMLLDGDFQPKRTIYLAFGHDEEVGGQAGASKIADLLKSRGIELEFVLDEGLCINDKIMPDVSFPVAMVGIAEKGYISVELTAISEGGHSMMPPKHTAIGIISTSIHKLERNQIPSRIVGPVKQSLEKMSSKMPFTKRLILSNLWLFNWPVRQIMASSKETNAMIRTTMAASIVEGGVKENVLPTQAKAVLNFRILPGDKVSEVIDHVHHTVKNSPVKIMPLEGPITGEPSEVSEINSFGFDIIQKTIRQIYPEVMVVPSLVTGATDSRHYAKLCKNIYRFIPIRLDPPDISRIHGINERILVENYKKIVKFYFLLIRNSDQ